MALPTVTHTYRIATDPEMRFSANGNPVIRLRLAANANRKTESGQWEKTDELFINATAFGEQAQAIADANLSVGQEVIVSGRLRTNSWETDQGEKRSVIELRLDSIGPKISPPRQNNGGGGGFGAPAAQQGGWSPSRGGQTPAEDQWGSGGRPGFSDEQPPF